MIFSFPLSPILSVFADLLRRYQCQLVPILENQSRSLIRREMPAPSLVVEVVSPGKEAEDRDYPYKRSEYAARGIPEYWIVDPIREQIVVLILIDGFYESTTYQKGDHFQCKFSKSAGR